MKYELTLDRDQILSEEVIFNRILPDLVNMKFSDRYVISLNKRYPKAEYEFMEFYNKVKLKLSETNFRVRLDSGNLSIIISGDRSTSNIVKILSFVMNNRFNEDILKFTRVKNIKLCFWIALILTIATSAVFIHANNLAHEDSEITKVSGKATDQLKYHSTTAILYKVSFRPDFLDREVLVSVNREEYLQCLGSIEDNRSILLNLERSELYGDRSSDFYLLFVVLMLGTLVTYPALFVFISDFARYDINYILTSDWEK